MHQKIDISYKRDVARYNQAIQRAEADIARSVDYQSKASAASQMGKSEESASKNREAVQIFEQAIQQYQQNLKRIQDNSKARQERYIRCGEIHDNLIGLRENLEMIRSQVITDQKDMQAWERLGSKARDDAEKASWKLLSSGVLSMISADLDDQIKLIDDTQALESVTRIKREMDRSIALYGITKDADKLGEKRDGESAVGLLITVLGQPDLQDYLKQAGKSLWEEKLKDKGLSAGGAASLFSFGFDYALYSATYYESWQRVKQLDENTESYLKAIEALHQAQKRNITQLLNDACISTDSYV